MKFVKYAFCFVLMWIFFSILPVSAHDEHYESDHHHTPDQCLMARFKQESGGFLLDFKDQLNLTDEQVEELKKMSGDLCGLLHDKKEEIHKEKEELKKILSQPIIDLKQFNIHLKKVYDMEYEFKCRAVAEFAKARDILTPSQKLKLKDILEKHFNK